jgi:hypothetical protein
VQGPPGVEEVLRRVRGKAEPDEVKRKKVV